MENCDVNFLCPDEDRLSKIIENKPTDIYEPLIIKSDPNDYKN